MRPFAKIMLALTALREKNMALARIQLQQLVDELPENPNTADPSVTGSSNNVCFILALSMQTAAGERDHRAAPVFRRYPAADGRRPG